MDEIESIRERNRRVESDKAWETSFSRRIIISLMIYFVVVVFLLLLKVSNPFVNALVPPVGYFLSTLTFPFLKKIWIEKIYKK